MNRQDMDLRLRRYVSLDYGTIFITELTTVPFNLFWKLFPYQHHHSSTSYLIPSVNKITTPTREYTPVLMTSIKHHAYSKSSGPERKQRGLQVSHLLLHIHESPVVLPFFSRGLFNSKRRKKGFGGNLRTRRSCSRCYCRYSCWGRCSHSLLRIHNP